MDTVQMDQSRCQAFGPRAAVACLGVPVWLALWIASVSRLGVVPLDRAVTVFTGVVCLAAAVAGLSAAARIWHKSTRCFAIVAVVAGIIGGGLRLGSDDATQVRWEWDCPSVRGQTAAFGQAYCWNEAHDAFELHADSNSPNDQQDWKSAVAARFSRQQQRFAKTLNLRLAIPPYAVFDEDNTVRTGGDGVEIVATATMADKSCIVSKMVVNAHKNTDQRRWIRWTVEIPARASAVRLEALPIGNNHYDRVLIRPESLHYQLPFHAWWRLLAVADAIAGALVAIVLIAASATLRGRIALGVGASAALAFLPAITAHFTYQDDLYLLLSAPHNCDFFATGLLAGRPIAGVFWQLIAAFGGDVASLGYARVCGLAGMMLVGWLTYAWLRAVGWRRAHALCSALLIMALPPSGLYIAWAVCTPFPLAAALAAAAVLLIFPHIREEEAGIRIRSRWLSLRLFAGGLCLLSGLTIYQPAAMYFWSLLAVFVVPAAGSGAAGTALRRLVRGAAVGGATMALYFVLFKLRGVISGLELPERTELSGDWPARLTWLTQRAFPATLALWDAHGRAVSLALVAGTGVAGMLASFVRGVRCASNRGAEALRRAMLLAALPLLVLLSICPNFASSDDWISYRILFAPMSLVALLVANALRSLDCSQGLRRASTIAFIALATFLMLVAARNVTVYFVFPHVQEYGFIRSRLLPALSAPLREIRIIRPAATDSAATLVCYDEYGRPSSYTDWGAEQMIRTVLREAEFAAWEQIKVIDETGACDAFSGALDAGVLRLDLRELSHFRSGPVRQR